MFLQASLVVEAVSKPGRVAMSIVRVCEALKQLAGSLELPKSHMKEAGVGQIGSLFSRVSLRNRAGTASSVVTASSSSPRTHCSHAGKKSR